MLQKWLGHAQLSTTAIYADAVGAEEQSIKQRMWGSELTMLICLLVFEAGTRDGCREAMAKHLHVSPATLYRQLTGGQTGATEGPIYG
jgi:AraC-like DNA-binding protein